MVVSTDPYRQTMTIGRAEIDMALKFLGDSPREVAHNLAAGGYTGDHTGGGCPVHQYLQACFPKISFAVDSAVVEAYVGSQRQTMMRLPDPVSDFVEEFDSGKYPELRSYQSDPLHHLVGSLNAFSVAVSKVAVSISDLSQATYSHHTVSTWSWT